MFPDLFRDDVLRLETRRLWLRWPTARDECTIERLAGDREVAEMTARIPHPYPKGSAASFIYQSRVGNAQGSGLTFALAPLARPAEAIGMISICSEDGVPTLGYWLGRPYWKKGLMSEAVETLVDSVFRLTSLDRIAASARADNPASRRVLEKTGFVQTGAFEMAFPARGREFDCIAYRLDRETVRPTSRPTTNARPDP